jgi:hypothetical protein
MQLLSLFPHKTRMVYNRTGGVNDPTCLGMTLKAPWSGESPFTSFQFLSKTGGADGVTPAQFPASGQRAGGEPSNGGLTSPTLSDII